MAKKIIILETHKRPRPNVSALFWLDVPVANQPHYARLASRDEQGNVISVYPDATAGELLDIENGVIAEKIEMHEFEIGITVASIRTAMEERFDLLQTKITNEDTYNFYGEYWDGAIWAT